MPVPHTAANCSLRDPVLAMPCHRPLPSSNTLHQPPTGAAPTRATPRRYAARLIQRLARDSVQTVLAVAGLWLGTSASAQAPMLATVGAVTPPSAAGTSHTGMPRPKIGLVLSGGGARGFAHVGVLKALEAAHVPVDVVVGTSMGAIVGGLYASGMSPQALETELMGVAWDTLFERRTPRQTLSQQRKEADFDLSPVFQIGFRDGEFRVPSGAVSTRSLEWLLRRYTLHTRHLTSFDALPTPFRAVATNMETGEPVVLANGDLAAALRASMSVPGVFAPLEVDGRLLGDGGLVNNLPVDVARALGTDVVIAVNIGTPLAGRESLGSVLGVSAQMINILTEQNVQRSLATLTRHDLLLAPHWAT
jgi:NTE family protein